MMGGWSVPNERYPELLKDSDEILRALTNNDAEHIKFTLDVAKDLFSNQQKRTKDIEWKASILIGAAGIAAAILMGIGAVLVDSRGLLVGRPGVLTAVFFVLLVVSFLWSLILALLVLLVGKAHYPGALIVLNQQSALESEYRKRHAADVYAAFTNNIERNNSKAGNLFQAQIAFGMFAVLLLGTGLIVASVSVFN